jgi:hypothetical protein
MIAAYECAEDGRRLRRLELFGIINKRRDLLRRRQITGSDELLRRAEAEYADLMRISRQAGFR